MTLQGPEQFHIKIALRKWSEMDRVVPFKSKQIHLIMVKLFIVSERDPGGISPRNKDIFCLFK